MANILTETFEASGYDNAGWTEQQTSETSPPDEDYSLSGLSPPSYLGSQGQYCYAQAATKGARSTWSAPSDHNINYFEFYIYINNESFANGQGACVFALQDGSSNQCTYLYMEQESDGDRVWQTYSNGTTPTAVNFGSWTTLQWYRVCILWDITNDLLEARVFECNSGIETLNGRTTQVNSSTRVGRKIMIGAGIIPVAYSDNVFGTTIARIVWDDAGWTGIPITTTTRYWSDIESHDSSEGGGWTNGSTYGNLARDSGTGTSVSTSTPSAAEKYNFDIGYVVDGLTILAVRLWMRAARYADDQRHMKLGAEINSSDYYNFDDFSQDFFPVRDSGAYYYRQWELNPDDNEDWEASDLYAFIGAICASTEPGTVAEPWEAGAYVYELWIEVIAAPDSSYNFITHASRRGGVTDGEIVVWCRASGASKIRIMYGPSEADVKSSTPESLVGSTEITDIPTSNNAVEDNDFCVNIPIVASTTGGSISASTVYYFDLYATLDSTNYTSIYDFEEGSSSYSFWNSLPYCETFPIEGDFSSRDVLVAGDDHESPMDHQMFYNVVGLSGKYPIVFVKLGDEHAAHSDVLNRQTEDSELITRNANLRGQREFYRQRRGFQLPNTLFCDAVEKVLPVEHIWSDHDFVGDNSTKSGHIPRYGKQDGGMLVWMKQTENVASGDGTEIDLDVADPAFSGSPSTITYAPAGSNPKASRIYLNVDGFAVEIKNSENGNNGFYTGNVVKDIGAESIIKLDQTLPGTDEVPLTSGNGYGDVRGVQTEIYQFRTWNAIKAFKEYNPTYNFVFPDDLVSQITGMDSTSSTTIVDIQSPERQFTYSSIVGGTPAIGDSISWDSTNHGTLVYHNSTDNVMVVDLDDNASILNGSDIVTNGVWSTSGSLSNIYNFPIESKYGIYQGMMAYHATDSDFSSDLSFSTVQSNDGTTITFNTPLRIGDHTFENGDYYRVVRQVIARTKVLAKTQWWMIDIRRKSDRQDIENQGLPGCDWLDGTREWVNAKTSGTATSHTASKLVDSGADFVNSGVVQGDVIVNKDMFRFTAWDKESVSPDFDAVTTVLWENHNDTTGSGDLIEATIDDHGDPELCINVTSGYNPMIGAKVMESSDHSNYYHIFGSLRNEWGVARVSNTLQEYITTTEITIEATYDSGVAKDLFPNGNEDYEIYESGGSNHAQDGDSDAVAKLRNEKAGHVQREWLVYSMNDSESEWKFILCETPVYGVQENSPGNQYQVLPTIDPLDCLRQYLVG